jgi:hypothetical protein
MTLGGRLIGPRHVVARLWLWPRLIITRPRLIVPLRRWRIVSLWPRSVILRGPGLIVAWRGIIAFWPGLVSWFGTIGPRLLAFLLMPRLRTAGFLAGRARPRIIVMILREAWRHCQSQHRDARGQPVPNLRRYFHPCCPRSSFRTTIQPNLPRHNFTDSRLRPAGLANHPVSLSRRKHHDFCRAPADRQLPCPACRDPPRLLAPAGY